METKFKSAYTTLELSNQEGLISIKLTDRVMGAPKIVEITLGKTSIAKVIEALKTLSE